MFGTPALGAGQPLTGCLRCRLRPGHYPISVVTGMVQGLPPMRSVSEAFDSPYLAQK
jgi:hypothetical protein